MIDIASHQTLIDSAALRVFAAGFGGEIITPDHLAYDGLRRVWNGRIDRYPALIVRPTNSQDVARAIGFARRQQLALTIRGGGHNAAGKAVADGGIMLDMALLRHLRIDPLGLRAYAGPGLTVGELLAGANQHGLVTTTGNNGTTGIAGMTLGGGIGWLMGQYGLTVDNLLSVELVTADRRVRYASAEEHGDLFWAVRGGGGNFGVVTGFEYQLHPLPQVYSGHSIFPFEQARAILQGYRAYSHAAPDELIANAALISLPNGQPAVMIALCYAGDAAAAQPHVVALHALGSPITAQFGASSYYDMIRASDGMAPAGRSYYDRTHSLVELNDEAIDLLISAFANRPAANMRVMINHIHGAAARVSPAATAASALRGEQYLVLIGTHYSNGDGLAYENWVRDSWARLRPLANPAVYVNFLGDEGAERVRAAYGANYSRLAAIKRSYDPDNLFRHNQNIRPA